MSILKIDNDSSVVAKLLYDQGQFKKATDPKYSDQWMWGLDVGGSQDVIYATPKLNDMLSNFRKGDMVTIGKSRTEQGGQAFYVMAFDSNDKNAGGVPAKTEPVKHNYSKPEVDWDLKDAKKEHEIRKAICIKLAVDKVKDGDWDKKIENQIRGKFTTLMLIMSDDLELVMHKLQTSINVFHLNAMFKKYRNLWTSILSEDDFGLVIDECTRLKQQFEAPEKEEAPPAEKVPAHIEEDVPVEELPF